MSNVLNSELLGKASRNPFLLGVGLSANTESLTIDELRQRVREVVEPRQPARQALRVEAFSAAEANGLGSDNLAEIAEAAAGGRVVTLLIEAGRQIGGRIDRKTGQVQAASLSHPPVDATLDDLGEMVEAMGGEVQVLPEERTPTRTGLSAVHCY